ncbi:hypothetical protein [Streptomyces sp. NBC_00344]|uniref:hypothetical protein n=1 Tax=Streptomyces sp. NBC_00344 TaxID=2975720 RepID=UPI002E201054
MTMLGAVPGPLLLTVTAAVLLLLKRRRSPYRQPAPWFITLTAFVVGALWAGAQGPSLINMIVSGVSAALLVGFGYIAYQRRKSLSR